MLLSYRRWDAASCSESLSSQRSWLAPTRRYLYSSERWIQRIKSATRMSRSWRCVEYQILFWVYYHCLQCVFCVQCEQEVEVRWAFYYFLSLRCTIICATNFLYARRDDKCNKSGLRLNECVFIKIRIGLIIKSFLNMCVFAILSFLWRVPGCYLCCCWLNTI